MELNLKLEPYPMRRVLFPSFAHFTRVRPKVTLTHIINYMKWLKYYDLKEYITLDGQEVTLEHIEELLRKDTFKERLYIVEDFDWDDITPITWIIKTIQ